MYNMKILISTCIKCTVRCTESDDKRLQLINFSDDHTHTLMHTHIDACTHTYTHTLTVPGNPGLHTACSQVGWYKNKLVCKYGIYYIDLARLSLVAIQGIGIVLETASLLYLQY